MITATETTQTPEMNFSQRLQRAWDHANEIRRQEAERDGREFHKISQVEMAKAIGASKSTVNGWLKQPTESPGMKFVAPLATFLGVSVNWLATEKGPMIVDASQDQAGESGTMSASSDTIDADRFIGIYEAIASAYKSLQLPATDQKLIRIACSMYPDFQTIDDAARGRIVTKITAILSP